MAVVAADYDPVHFSRLEELGAGFDPVDEVHVLESATDIGRGAQQERGMPVRHVPDIIVDPGRGIALDADVAIEHKSGRKQSQDGKRLESELHS